MFHFLALFHFLQVLQLVLERPNLLFCQAILCLGFFLPLLSELLVGVWSRVNEQPALSLTLSFAIILPYPKYFDSEEKNGEKEKFPKE